MSSYRVMLISPSSTIVSGKFKNCMLPLGLGYLAAVLEENGFEVEILDCALEGYRDEVVEGKYLTLGLRPNDIYERIKEFSPNLVGISCIFSMRKNNMHVMVGVVKRINKNIPVVLGGHHPSALPGETLKDKKRVKF